MGTAIGAVIWDGDGNFVAVIAKRYYDSQDPFNYGSYGALLALERGFDKVVL